jgi:PhnB protein
MAVRAIPEGYEAAIPYLSVTNAAGAIEFYKRAFGAVELTRMTGPDGRVGHAEIRIGKALLMLADEHPEIDFHSPKSLGVVRSPGGDSPLRR